MDKRLYDLSAIIARYGMSKETIRRKTMSGQFPHPVPGVKGKRYWHISDLEQWEASILEK